MLVDDVRSQFTATPEPEPRERTNLEEMSVRCSKPSKGKIVIQRPKHSPPKVCQKCKSPNALIRRYADCTDEMKSRVWWPNPEFTYHTQCTECGSSFWRALPGFLTASGGGGR